MRILIFGASGRTGREVVRHALERQHVVTAFARQPSKLVAKHPQLRLIEGDVGDLAAVRAAMPGQDAVVSTLGVATPLKHDPVVIVGMRHIAAAMREVGVRRLIYQSFIGVSESRAAVGFVLRFVAPILLREEIADHEVKEAIVKSSGTDWTIVRPPKLTDRAASGRYRIGDGIRTWVPLPMLARADVAEFIVRELEQPAYIHKAPRLLP